MHKLGFASDPLTQPPNPSLCGDFLATKQPPGGPAGGGGGMEITCGLPQDGGGLKEAVTRSFAGSGSDGPDLRWVQGLPHPNFCWVGVGQTRILRVQVLTGPNFCGFRF